MASESFYTISLAFFQICDLGEIEWLPLLALFVTC